MEFSSALPSIDFEVWGGGKPPNDDLKLVSLDRTHYISQKIFTFKPEHF